MYFSLFKIFTFLLFTKHTHKIMDWPLDAMGAKRVKKAQGDTEISIHSTSKMENWLYNQMLVLKRTFSAKSDPICFRQIPTLQARVHAQVNSFVSRDPFPAAPPKSDIFL